MRLDGETSTGRRCGRRFRLSERGGAGRQADALEVGGPSRGANRERRGGPLPVADYKARVDLELSDAECVSARRLLCSWFERR